MLADRNFIRPTTPLSTFDYTQLQLYSHLSVLPVFQSVHVLKDK